MTHRLRLKIASVSFAVLWTVWMLWWSSPLRPAEIAIIGSCGVVIGFAWHLVYGRWYRWHLARKVFPRRQSR